VDGKNIKLGGKDENVLTRDVTGTILEEPNNNSIAIKTNNATRVNIDGSGQTTLSGNTTITKNLNVDGTIWLGKGIFLRAEGGTLKLCTGTDSTKACKSVQVV
jgi:hypothetical protein